tara:strand:+ start:85 stop:447 length:363 start_codon:yes stop_codon:yes gene_type:complete
VWDEVKKYLESALDHSGGEYSLEHLKMFIVQGHQTLLVIIDDDKICGALTIEWINYPNDRIAFISAVGGKTDIESWGILAKWAKDNGGTAVRGATFKSVAKLMKQQYGFKETYIMVEKRL